LCKNFKTLRQKNEEKGDYGKEKLRAGLKIKGSGNKFIEESTEKLVGGSRNKIEGGSGDKIEGGSRDKLEGG
jgi:hypothetical protein